MGVKSVAALAVLGTLAVATRSTLVLAATAGLAGYLVARRARNKDGKDCKERRIDVGEKAARPLDSVKYGRCDSLTMVKDPRRYVLDNSPFLITISGFKVRALSALKVINPPPSLLNEVEATVKLFRGKVSAIVVLSLNVDNTAYVIFAVEKHVLHVTEKTVRQLTEKLAAALPALPFAQGHIEASIISGEDLAKMLNGGFAL